MHISIQDEDPQTYPDHSRDVRPNSNREFNNIYNTIGDRDYRVTIEVIATDGVGNATHPPRRIEGFHIDRIPPSLSVNSLPTPTNIGELVISGSTEAGSEVFISIDGEQQIRVEVNPDGSFTHLITTRDKAYYTTNVTIKAIDSAGNESTWAQGVAVDRRPPDIIFTDSSGNSINNVCNLQNSKFQVNVVTDEAATLRFTNIVVRPNDGIPSNISNPVFTQEPSYTSIGLTQESSNAYTCSLPRSGTYILDVSTEPNREYFIEMNVHAMDQLGNSADFPITIKVDNRLRINNSYNDTSGTPGFEIRMDALCDSSFVVTMQGEDGTATFELFDVVDNNIPVPQGATAIVTVSNSNIQKTPPTHPGIPFTTYTATINVPTNINNGVRLRFTLTDSCGNTGTLEAPVTRASVYTTCYFLPKLVGTPSFKKHRAQSIVVDGKGDPHIAFVERQPILRSDGNPPTEYTNHLMYMKWQKETMDWSLSYDVAVLNDEHTKPSLMVDGEGIVHMCYTNRGNIYYETRQLQPSQTGGNFTLLSAETPLQNGCTDCSLALDASGNPHIAYVKDAKLGYAYKDSSG